MEITKKTIASYSICYSLALNIYSVIFDNYVIAGWSNENKCKKYKLYSNKKGDYFCINKQRYYLDNFIRIK